MLRGDREKKWNLQPVVVSGDSLPIPFLSLLYGVTHVLNPSPGSSSSNGADGANSSDQCLHSASHGHVTPIIRMGSRLHQPPESCLCHPSTPQHPPPAPTPTEQIQGQGRATFIMKKQSHLFYLWSWLCHCVCAIQSTLQSITSVTFPGDYVVSPSWL